MKKVLLSLIFTIVAFAVKADRTVVLDFTGWNFPGADSWESTYAAHTVNFDDATVSFVKVNKQPTGNTIDTCPVTKGQDITVSTSEDIVSATVAFKQWGTKTKTASLYVGNNEVATTSDFAFTDVTVGAKEFTLKFSEQNNQVGLQSITLVLGGTSQEVVIEAPVITPATGTYNEAQTVSISAAEGLTIFYTLDGETPDQYSEIFTESFALKSSAVVKAIAVDVRGNSSRVATANISILRSIANDATTAYTTAEAIKLIDDASSNLNDTVYVRGVVSNIDGVNSKYKSLTYWLDDKSFEVYSGYGLNKDSITSEDYLAVGDTVIVCGKIKKYNDVYEFNSSNYLVSIVKPETVAPVVSIKNTPETPYTVAHALELIAAGEDLDTRVYVAGTIVSVQDLSWDANAEKYYGNATYFIADEGAEETQLEVYRGYSVKGNKFVNENEIKAGDKVIVYGKLVEYKGTKEFSAGSEIYSLNGSTSAIRRIEVDAPQTTDLSHAVIYNICGQRVSDMSRKGIYIVNGKKVIVK